MGTWQRKRKKALKLREVTEAHESGNHLSFIGCERADLTHGVNFR